MLKPDGRLYLTANGIGWQLHLWKQRHNATTDYDPREMAALSFMNTVQYERTRTPPQRGQIIIERDALQSELMEVGLAVVAIGEEGSICVPAFFTVT